MRRVDVAEAIGLTLGHDITEIVVDEAAGRRSKRVAFPRGHIITAEDIPHLLNLGKSAVFIAHPADNEMHEDDAALAVAPKAAGANVEHGVKPHEGKLNFHAMCDGVFQVDLERLYRINKLAIPTMVTLLTYSPVQKGQQVAGFRILPLTCDPAIIEAVVAELDTPLLSVAPYVLKTAAIVVTGSEVYEGRVKDAFQPRLRKTLEPFGVAVTFTDIVPDDRDRIARTVREAAGQADIVFVTGGTSVDPDDVTVGAMQDAGANFPVRGMPMQPGNNLTLGSIGETPVCAVPAATIFNEVTSLDVLLPRLLACIPVTAEDIHRLGHGGLAQKTCDGNFPDCTFGSGR